MKRTELVIAKNRTSNTVTEVGASDLILSQEKLGVEIVETNGPSDEDFRLATSLVLAIGRVASAAFHQSFENAGPLYTTPVFEQLVQVGVPGEDGRSSERL